MTTEVGGLHRKEKGVGRTTDVVGQFKIDRELKKDGKL